MAQDAVVSTSPFMFILILLLAAAAVAVVVVLKKGGFGSLRKQSADRRDQRTADKLGNSGIGSIGEAAEILAELFLAQIEISPRAEGKEHSAPDLKVALSKEGFVTWAEGREIALRFRQTLRYEPDEEVDVLVGTLQTTLEKTKQLAEQALIEQMQRDPVEGSWGEIRIDEVKYDKRTSGGWSEGALSYCPASASFASSDEDF